MWERKPTDDKLDEELKNGGWNQEKPNQYGNRDNLFDVIETDGDYYRINGGPWQKR